MSLVSVIVDFRCFLKASFKHGKARVKPNWYLGYVKRSSSLGQIMDHLKKKNRKRRERGGRKYDLEHSSVQL